MLGAVDTIRILLLTRRSALSERPSHPPLSPLPIAASILKLPYTAASRLWYGQSGANRSSTPLALHAELLLLALAFLPVPSEEGRVGAGSPVSPYRLALRRLQDAGTAKVPPAGGEGASGLRGGCRDALVPQIPS